MKKFLCLLLAVMMLLGCLPAMAEAGTFTANADKHMITAYKGEDENLVVPASVDGVPTPIINWQTINGAKKAVTLTLEEGITQIRSNNIASLNITQLTLPSTLEVIANNNIYQTDKLTEVTVPAAVSYVGTLTFSYCDVLTKVTFTGLCPVFGPRTFVSTAKDLVVYVPDDQLDAYKAALPEGLNIQPSGKNAVDARVRVSESDFEFDAATGTIKKYNGTASYIEIPATIGGVQVKTIGQKAFYQHPYMTVVIIPEGVETLEMYSIFAGSGLYRVELPSTLKTIGNNALWGAELDSVKLPEGLEKIGDGAFTNGMYSKVEELIIPDSVTSIGKEAFKGCTPIKIIIGANVQSLAEGAFGALNYVEEVVIRNTNGMTIDPKAFQSSKKGATITLMDGITEEVYNSYVEQLAVAYESATVNQPELAAAFPTLDAEAGAPYIGSWAAVAVTDGADFYGMDLLGISMTVVLNDDGTGVVDMDGDAAPGGWYVENGAAIFAPILEEGGQPVPEEAMPFTLDENGRMCLDLGGLIVLMEKEGAEYAVPALPEMPWPELNLENAQAFVGTWVATSYVMDGESYPAELFGAMTLTLNADGTAISAEPGEEPYALKWYADYGTAYVGPAMSALAQVTFDGTGNIQMAQDGATIIFAPLSEPAPAPSTPAWPELNQENAAPFIGTWVAKGYIVDGHMVDAALIEPKALTLAGDGTAIYYIGQNPPYGLRWYADYGTAYVGEAIDTACVLAFEGGGNIRMKVGDQEIILVPHGEPVPAAFEMSWPELNQANAVCFTGTWVARSYIIDGQTVDAAQICPKALTLLEDGTAIYYEGENPPCTWRWIANYGTAYIGETANSAHMLYFDSNGSLQMIQDGSEIIFAPLVDATPAPTAEPAPEPVVNPTVGGEHLLGDWYDDLGNKLTLAADGSMSYTYASDGWTYNEKWAVVDGEAIVTEGRWEGAAIYTRDGIVFIDNDEGIFQLFSADGDLSAYYGDDEEDYELPESQPIGEEGAAYFGTWKADMFGMEVLLSLNQDGTCAMEMFGESEPGVWSVVDGKANIMGDEIFVDGDGNLVYESMGIVFTKAETEEAAGDDGEMSEEEQLLAFLALLAQMEEQDGGEADQPQDGSSYTDTTFVLTKAETIYNGMSFPVDAAAFGEYNVRFNSDGSAALVQSGLELPSEYLTWSNNDAGQYVIDYSVNGVPVMEYVFIPAEGALTFDYYGTLMTFTPAE